MNKITGGFLACLFLIIVSSPNILGQVPDTLELLFQWDDDSLKGSAAYNNTYNEVWGFEQNGEEFAIIGSTAGTHILPLDSIHGDKSPIFVPSPSSGIHVIHRDYHDYKGYLYAVCDEGQNATLQIIDLRNIRDGVEIVYDSNEYFSRAHNIFIDSATAKLYVCSHKAEQYSSLGIYDISNPTEPEQLGTYLDFEGLGGPVHDAFVHRDTAFLNCGYRGLVVVDFSDTDNPNVLASLTEYPFQGYNHSGWATPEQDYYYMADENHGFDMKTIRINNISDLEVVGTFDAGDTSSYSIPHNQLVQCNFLYVSYYFNGLQVYDISDAESPERKYVYPTSTIAPYENYKGAWGVYPYLPSGRVLVSDMQNGLFVLNGPDCAFPTPATQQFQSNNYTIYPNPTNGTINISSPKPILEGSLKLVNMNGQCVFECSINQALALTLPENIPNGSYIAEIKDSGNIEYHRLFLVR